MQTHTYTHTLTANEINFCIFVCVCASVFLTSWTSPKAPLPITLTTSKSSPRMRCVLTMSTLFESETLWSWNLYTLCSLSEATLYNYITMRMGNTGRDAFDWIQTNCSCQWGKYDSHFHMVLDIYNTCLHQKVKKIHTLTFLVNIQVPHIPVNTPNITSQIRQ